MKMNDLPEKETRSNKNKHQIDLRKKEAEQQEDNRSGDDNGDSMKEKDQQTKFITSATGGMMTIADDDTIPTVSEGNSSKVLGCTDDWIENDKIEPKRNHNNTSMVTTTRFTANTNNTTTTTAAAAEAESNTVPGTAVAINEVVHHKDDYQSRFARKMNSDDTKNHPRLAASTSSNNNKNNNRSNYTSRLASKMGQSQQQTTTTTETTSNSNIKNHTTMATGASSNRKNSRGNYANRLARKMENRQQQNTTTNDTTSNNDINRLEEHERKLSSKLTKMDISRASNTWENHHLLQHDEEVEDENGNNNSGPVIFDTSDHTNNNNNNNTTTNSKDNTTREKNIAGRTENTSVNLDGPSEESDEEVNEELLPGAYARESLALGVNFNARRIAETEDDISNYGREASIKSRGNRSSKTFEVEAFAVDDNEEITHARQASFIRRDIIEHAVMAEEVEPVNDDGTDKLTRYLVCLLVVLVVIGLVVGLSVGLTQNNDNYDNMLPSEIPSLSPSARPTEETTPVLETVASEGILRCAVAWEGIGYYVSPKDNKTLEGIEVELCRAVSAALFNSTDNAKISITTWADRWDFVENRSIDILTASSTHNMERDVYQETAKKGFSFSAPFLYDGLAFGGVPEFVDCADDTDAFFGICRFTKVCLADGTTSVATIKRLLPDNAIKIVQNNSMMYQSLIDGSCNVICSTIFTISDELVRKAGYSGDYKIGNKRFSTEPFAMATRHKDPQWTDFVNYVLQSLFWAEANNITQDKASQMPVTDVFGAQHQNMFRYAVAAVGNYAEVYDRTLKRIAAREGRNFLNTNGSTGLIYSHPFGPISNTGPGPTNGGTLERILKRGYLRCGVVGNRTGFAELNETTQTWSGLDVDYCNALSASILSTHLNATNVIVDVAGNDEQFLALNNTSIDVLTGGNLNITTDVREPTTEEGYTFTQPYFYGSSPTNDSQRQHLIAIATRQDDPQWSDFVYHIVESTFYAEEYGITSAFSERMPEVHLFGPNLTKMFQSAIAATSHYGDMYSRNVEKIHQRKGTRNELNSNPVGPQHFPIPITT